MQIQAVAAMTMSDLRRKLWEITETLPPEEHPARIEALRVEHDHLIDIIESEHSIGRYTCGVHAFGLTEDPTYLAVADWGLGKTFAGADFITFLLRNYLLTPRTSIPVAGDLVVYSDAGSFRHIGRMKSANRVLSKWGVGLLYEHGVWEVPLQYGQDVQYFVGPDDDASFRGFRFKESRHHD